MSSRAPHSRHRSHAPAPGASGAAGGGQSARAQAERVARQAPLEVRIIGGAYKRSPLKVPVWPGLRPTPARVRETLFNWLGQDLNGWRVLDAFAGTGALGLEAASRGAAAVLALEKEPALARQIEANARQLGARQVQVQVADALAWMRRQPAPAHDLVFLDPPFGEQMFAEALAAGSQCVPVGGWIYLEADAPQAALPHLRLHRHDRAGAVHYHLFERMA
jgi:16S rRNA (guanine966-N2)-methyltransferase